MTNLQLHVGFKSAVILMELEGSSKANPICLSDSSPVSTPVSPVKFLMEEEKRKKCRKLVLELESSCESSDMEGECELPLSPCTKTPKRKLVFSSSSSNSSDSSSGNENDGGSDSCSPVYEVPSSVYTGEQILKILLSPRLNKKKICHTQPTNVTRSSTFVVDLESLKHPDDIKKDDFGKWVYSGSHSVSYAAFQAGSSLEFERVSGRPTSKSDNVFQLRRINCNHPLNSQCQRLLAFVTAPTGDPHHLCLLSYHIPRGFKKKAVAHGNSKVKVPFYPTLPSTKGMMTKELTSTRSGPKQTISVVSAKVGGVTRASSACDLPRNERQASYLKSRTLKLHPSSQDPLADQVFTIMQQTKLDDHAGKFVRDCRPCPEPAFVLARDQQLDDLVRFCTLPGNFSVLTVDPTFNLGDFDVTPTAFRNLLLESVRYGTHPIMIGPTLVHYRKTFGTYLFFASSLIGLRPELRALQAFGTDGEKALADAFGHEYRYATRLSCFIHCRQNIKQQLRDRHFPEAVAKTVLDDIFGCQQGEVFAEGLVDSASNEDFSTKLLILEKRWNEIETCNSQITPGFHGWFLHYKADIMKHTMLQPVREEAGLGSPPQTFTTNASEAVNSVIKNQVGYKSHQLIQFVDHLKAVVDEQYREIERAIIGRGKYRLKKQYSFLQVSEERWFKMNESQRLDHIKKVSTTKVEEHMQSKALSMQGLNTSGFSSSSSSSGFSSSSSSSGFSSSSASKAPVNSHMSVDVNTVAANVSVPLDSLKGIWQKAEELLQSPEGMSSAPGQPEQARMVLSRSGKRPHLVLPCKGGRFKCDADCLNFKSLGLCSHTVAVAECNSVLSDFLTHFQKANKKPSFTALSLHGVPGGCGKKGGIAPRKRKKQGPSSANKRVDRLEGMDVQSMSASTTGTASPVAQVCGASTVNISVDSLPGPSSTVDTFVPSSPWSSPYYDWGYSSYYPPPLMYPPPFGQHDATFSLPGSMTPSASPSSMTPPPMADDNSPFKLHFISGNIAKCAGCGNKYTKPAVPPYDLCVQHREWRTFTVSGAQQSKFSPAYYHVNAPCIKKNWPLFFPQHILITSDVFAKLSQIHKDYLLTNGFMSPNV